MLDWIIIAAAITANGANGANGGGSPGSVPSIAPLAINSVIEGTTDTPETDDAGGFGIDETVPQYVAESQVSTGKFTTATEVKPILETTKGSWVALREYNGQDLLYFTHLMSWRCGLLAVKYSVNNGPMVDWPLPDCHVESGWANAITPEDGLVYGTYALGSVQSVNVELVFDDLTTGGADFIRSKILMP